MAADRPQPTITQGTLTPAYGRDYKSKKACILDFQKGVDFRFNYYTGSTYCSISNCNAGELIKFRYNNGQHVAFYTVCDADVG